MSKEINEKTIPEFLDSHGFQVLRALVVFGGMAPIEQVANYLGWNITEVSSAAVRLQTWKLIRIFNSNSNPREKLQLSQYGEIAVLEKCGLDIHGYVELVTSYYEEWRDYFRKY